MGAKVSLASRFEALSQGFTSEGERARKVTPLLEAGGAEHGSKLRGFGVCWARVQIPAPPLNSPVSLDNLSHFS